MKVELINKEEVKELFTHWSKFSSVCYNSKINENKPELIGKHCMNSGHFSGSRSRYFEFLITDCPRFTIDQCVRHEQGCCKNVQSFRYVSKDKFAYEVPIEITDNRELLNRYHNHMKNTIELYEDIQDYVLFKTGTNERANEQARYVLPMSTHSAFVIGFSLEALIHLMNERLCIRTEDVFRGLAIKIKECVVEILPELENKLIPQCADKLYCPEKYGCGLYPTKEKIKEIINASSRNN